MPPSRPYAKWPSEAVYTAFTLSRSFSNPSRPRKAGTIDVFTMLHPTGRAVVHFQTQTFCSAAAPCHVRTRYSLYMNLGARYIRTFTLSLVSSVVEHSTRPRKKLTPMTLSSDPPYLPLCSIFEIRKKFPNHHTTGVSRRMRGRFPSGEVWKTESSDSK